MILWSGIIGDNTELRIAPDRITLRLGNLVRRRSRILMPDDIAAVAVREILWESAAPTYALKITLASGTVLSAGDYASREAAAEHLGTVNLALGRV